MKNNWKWILGITIGLIVIFFLPTLYQNMFGLTGFGRGVFYNHPMMHDPVRSYSMMWPVGGFFMGFGMLLSWLFPIGLLLLLVFGAVALLNRTRTTPLNGSSTPVTQSGMERHCGNCGKAAETDWNVCPYCGEKL